MKTNRDWKVVFIDDETDIREVVSITIADAGYRVWCAENGESGIRLSRQLSPQIVIADVRIPEVDGIRVLKTLKQILPDTKVIVVMVFREIGLAIRALRFDVSDIIPQPPNGDALHRAMTRAKSHFIAHELNPELHLAAGS